ncbi:hypothetical protein D9Q98_001419 [Chlorella vulgaris]|uniref:Uncharacterized protein n=1 Tax=Chlorella vulgaris TaxID=3077 RepID=A0A9D4U040_CHLVU|nr:hypothetical protein D9Q98_001419 [Chlorella vulgaris]
MWADEAVHPSAGPETSTKQHTHNSRVLGILWTKQRTVQATTVTRAIVGRRGSHTHVTERCSRRTTLRNGKLVEETVHETCYVEDHLGQLYSARVSFYRNGRLVSEAAAMYLPQPKATSLAVGSLAASNAGSAGSEDAARAGSSSKDSAPAASKATLVDCQVVGYWLRDGVQRYGIVKDPAALGLPRQRAVTRASLERVRPPPWHVHSSSSCSSPWSGTTAEQAQQAQQAQMARHSQQPSVQAARQPRELQQQDQNQQQQQQ